MNLAPSPLYLRDLPLEVRIDVCRILDEDRVWEALVRKLLELKINVTTVEELENAASPADKLFLKLTNHNFKDGPLKVATFYKISTILKLHKLMHCLTPYVSEDLIKNLQDVMKQPTAKVNPVNNFNTKQTNPEVYLYQLPEDKKVKLCHTLNHNDDWRMLMAKFEKFGFTVNHIQLCDMNSPSNPAGELFKLLADRNVKISLLYLALASMNLPEAMTILQCYVSENLMKNVQHRHNFKSNVSKLSNKRTNNVDEINQASNSNEKPDIFIRRGISYGELLVMTNQWGEKNRLGLNRKGNFYHGIQNDGTHVAVKRLILEDEKQSLKVLEELRQLECFAREGPKSLLQMLMLIEGVGDSNPCIIYPFKEKKSLYDHLMNKGFATSSDGLSSSWKQKLIIALGVTEALIYLQRSFGENIFVVKSSDIILDDTMEPLVADVVLPSMVNRNRSEYLAMYMPQEEEQEIKSFCLGTILLELATDDPADRFKKHPGQLRRIKDITMETGVSKKFSGKWKSFILNCTQIKGVPLINILEELKDIQDF